MSSKSIVAIAMNKMGVADVELARRCRARLKAINAHINKLDVELAEVKEKDFFLWHEYVVVANNGLRELSAEKRGDLWEESKDHKYYQKLIESYNVEIVFYKQKIKKIEECAETLLVDLTIED